MCRIVNRRHGFTLVELLVVIAIIALLLSILMPALQKVREQAKFIPCGSNLRQFHMAFMLYANDNGYSTIPGYLWSTAKNRSDITDSTSYNADAMNTRKVVEFYFKSPRSWKCPGDSGLVYNLLKQESSYYYEWYVLSRKYGTFKPYNVNQVKSRKVLQFTRTSETLVFGHQWVFDGMATPNYYTGEGVYFPHKTTKKGMAQNCLSIYLDGHSEKKTWKKYQDDCTMIQDFYKVDVRE